jgi:hypothetical protein
VETANNPTTLVPIDCSRCRGISTWHYARVRSARLATMAVSSAGSTGSGMCIGNPARIARIWSSAPV